MVKILIHLSNMVDGANMIFGGISKNRKYKRVSNGFHEDQKNLRSDVSQIGNDIRCKAKEAYGRQ